MITRFTGRQPVKWIGLQRYAPQFLNRDQMPVRIAKGALGPNQPTAPLYISPGHSMLVGGTLVLAKNLVNGITVTQNNATGIVEYYAIELERHDCALANGAWSESFADGPGLRRQFHNLFEFESLFPHYVEPDEIALCAPRPLDGPFLEATLRPLLARLTPLPGALLGNLEVSGPEFVQGWAWDHGNPDLPVELEILAGEQLLGQALACHFRSDLAAAGLGRGHCMFSFRLPPGTNAPLTIRRLTDRAKLPAAQSVAA